MKCWFFILFFAFLLPAVQAQTVDTRCTEAVKLNRPSHAGERHRFKIHCTVEETLRMETAAEQNRRVRSQCMIIDAAGELDVLRVNAGGNASKIDFTLDTFRVTFCGKAVKLPLTRCPMSADLSVKTPHIVRHDGKELTENELEVLRLIFRPASNETMNDLFGSDSAVCAGKWDGPKAALIRAFRENQLDVSESHVQNCCTAQKLLRDSDLCTFLTLDCKLLHYKDVDFSLSLQVLLPRDPTLPERMTVRRTRFATRQLIDAEQAPVALPEEAALVRQSDEIMILETQLISKQPTPSQGASHP